MIEFIGDAGVGPGSVDLVISNCVINLSPDKEAVVRGCHEALRDGGELYFSDVYCDRRLPQATRSSRHRRHTARHLLLPTAVLPQLRAAPFLGPSLTSGGVVWSQGRRRDARRVPRRSSVH